MRTEQNSPNTNRSPDLVYLELPALLIVIFGMLFVMSAGSAPTVSPRAVDSAQINATSVVKLDAQSRTLAVDTTNSNRANNMVASAPSF